MYLIKYPNIRLNISYAKYLYEVSHKTLVKDGYEVDHIDGDKTNNTVKNLQVLSKKENLKKSFNEGTYKLLHKYTRFLLWCPVCNKKFTRMKSKTDTLLLDKGKKFYFCSTECQHISLFKSFIYPDKQKYKNIKIDWDKYKHKNCYENPKEYSTKFFTKRIIKRIKFISKKRPLVYISKKLKVPKSILNKVIKYKINKT